MVMSMNRFAPANLSLIFSFRAERSPLRNGWKDRGVNGGVRVREFDR